MVALSAVVSRYPTSTTSSATSTCLPPRSTPTASRTEPKRKALEAAYPDVVTDDLPGWNQDPGLLDWLTNL